MMAIAAKVLRNGTQQPTFVTWSSLTHLQMHVSLGAPTALALSHLPALSHLALVPGFQGYRMDNYVGYPDFVLDGRPVSALDGEGRPSILQVFLNCLPTLGELQIICAEDLSRVHIVQILSEIWLHWCARPTNCPNTRKDRSSRHSHICQRSPSTESPCGLLRSMKSAAILNGTFDICSIALHDAGICFYRTLLRPSTDRSTTDGA
ncbi:hypothetical protein U1Q18_044729 [Sarracenia purpurea var. burkii]